MATNRVMFEKMEWSGHDARLLAADICRVAHRAYSDLVTRYTILNATQSDVDARFGGPDAPAQAHFERALHGSATNRLGERRAVVYTARAASDWNLLGWLTAAEDYSNNPIKKRMRSYLWLVNGGVLPEAQGQGIMKGLIRSAMLDPDSPRVVSKDRFVTAYPPVIADAGEEPVPAEDVFQPPVVTGLHRLSILPTDPPFIDNGLFGADIFLQRHQGPSPAEVAERLDA